MIDVVPGAVSAAAFDVVIAAAAAAVSTAWVFPEDGPAVMADGGEELLDADGDGEFDLDGDGLDGLDLGDGNDVGDDLGGGDFDDGGLDGGGGGGGAPEPDLEPRVDELEAQLENISGQVNSAQHESEELREAMERIEDNVRQLLDIYALVTKGANPFTDDSGGPMDMDIGESLDIFDTDDEEAEEDEEETEGEMADTDDMLDDLDEMQEEAREELEEAEANLDDREEDEEAAEDEEGTTFDDLKSEYESDEALEGMAGEEDHEEDAEVDEEEATEDETEEDADEDAEVDDEGAIEDETEDEADEDAEAGFEFDNESATTGADGAKPYLEALPDGYGTDVLVMEWLEFLVVQSDPRRAARAIERYETLGWLGAPAAERLRAILSGARFDGAGTDGTLSADHHRRSLEYIARLGDGTFGDAASMLATNGAGPPRSAIRPDGGDR